METIESKVAGAILQTPDEIVVGGKIYQFFPPSTATLILVSEAISQMPQIKLENEKVVEDSLYAARYCRVLGEIVAIFILGAKHLTEIVKVRQTKEKRILWGLIRHKRDEEVEQIINHKQELANALLEDLTPRELHTLTSQLLMKMQFADFFGLTTFLIDVNLLRQTKVEKTTAFGQ